MIVSTKRELPATFVADQFIVATTDNPKMREAGTPACIAAMRDGQQAIVLMLSPNELDLMISLCQRCRRILAREGGPQH